jgi:hypothetical protein
MNVTGHCDEKARGCGHGSSQSHQDQPTANSEHTQKHSEVTYNPVFTALRRIGRRAKLGISHYVVTGPLR